MKDINKEKFDINFNHSYSSNKQPQNLKCVCLEEFTKYIQITAYESLTFIKKSIQFSKCSRKMWIKKNSELDKYEAVPVKKPRFYSLFVGIYQKDQKSYLVFAKNVKLVDFVRKDVDIFQIDRIKVYSIQDQQIDYKILGQGFYFSYDFDLTKPFSLLNVKEYRNYKQPNWLYFVNRTMLKPLFKKSLNSWITPIIYGNIYFKRINFQIEKLHAQVSVIIKSSINQFLFLEEENPVIKKVFFCNNYENFDLILTVQKKFFLINFTASQMQNLNSQNRICKLVKTNNFCDLFCIDKTFFKIKSQKKPRKSIYQKYKIIEFSNDENYQQTEFFKYFISPYIESNIKINNCICFLLNNNYDSIFNFQYFIGLFILSAKQIYQKEIVNFKDDYEHIVQEFQKQFYKEYQQYRQSLQKLRDIYSKQKIKNGFFNKILANFEYNDDSQYSDSMSHKTQQVMDTLFYDFNEDIQNLFYQKEYPKKSKKIQFQILTHNCGGYKFYDEKFQYFTQDQLQSNDVIVIGLQEIVEMKSKNLKKIILEENSKSRIRWTNHFRELIGEQFQLFHTQDMVGLCLLVFVKNELIQNNIIYVQNTLQIKLGKFNLANKGSLCCEIIINYQSFIFFNCHLASGQKEINFTERIQNLERILENLDCFYLNTHYFLFGDLNFRNKIDYELISNINNGNIDKQQFIQKFVEKDEFLIWLEQQKDFALQEFEIKFLPSYKYKLNEQIYDMKDGKRIPSYTDRILYGSRKINEISNMQYKKVSKIIFSDHRPVSLKFEVLINKMTSMLFINDFYSRLKEYNYLNQQIIFQNNLYLNCFKFMVIKYNKISNNLDIYEKRINAEKRIRRLKNRR